MSKKKAKDNWNDAFDEMMEDFDDNKITYTDKKTRGGFTWTILKRFAKNGFHILIIEPTRSLSEDEIPQILQDVRELHPNNDWINYPSKVEGCDIQGVKAKNPDGSLKFKFGIKPCSDCERNCELMKKENKLKNLDDDTKVVSMTMKKAEILHAMQGEADKSQILSSLKSWVDVVIFDESHVLAQSEPQTISCNDVVRKGTDHYIDSDLDVNDSDLQKQLDRCKNFFEFIQDKDNIYQYSYTKDTEHFEVSGIFRNPYYIDGIDFYYNMVDEIEEEYEIIEEDLHQRYFDEDLGIPYQKVIEYMDILSSKYLRYHFEIKDKELQLVISSSQYQTIVRRSNMINFFDSEDTDIILNSASQAEIEYFRDLLNIEKDDIQKYEWGDPNDISKTQAFIVDDRNLSFLFWENSELNDSNKQRKLDVQKSYINIFENHNEELLNVVVSKEKKEKFKDNFNTGPVNIQDYSHSYYYRHPSLIGVSNPHQVSVHFGNPLTPKNAYKGDAQEFIERDILSEDTFNPSEHEINYENVDSELERKIMKKFMQETGDIDWDKLTADELQKVVENIRMRWKARLNLTRYMRHWEMYLQLIQSTGRVLDPKGDNRSLSYFFNTSLDMMLKILQFEEEKYMPIILTPLTSQHYNADAPIMGLMWMNRLDNVFDINIGDFDIWARLYNGCHIQGKIPSQVMRLKGKEERWKSFDRKNDWHLKKSDVFERIDDLRND